MPVSAPRICGCGNVVSSGSRCACQLKRYAERKARHDQRRPSARERGYDKKWDFERKAYLRSHPYCRKCKERGVRVLASLVDHIIPHKGDKVLFWSKGNWQSLCVHCHSSHKQREERR